jgi:hypothetical protein
VQELFATSLVRIKPTAFGRATLAGSADAARFFGFMNSWTSRLVPLVPVEAVSAYPLAASKSSYEPGKGYQGEATPLVATSCGPQGSSRNRPRPRRGLPVCASPPFGGLLKATASGRGPLLYYGSQPFGSAGWPLELLRHILSVVVPETRPYPYQ